MNHIKLKILIILLVITASPSIAQYNFDAFFSNAKNDIDKNNFVEALSKLNKCLLVQPDNIEVFFYRALCKYNLSDFYGAEQDFTKAISSNSFIRLNSYHYRSLARYRLGKYKDAIDDINKVLEEQKDDASLYVERAYINLSNNNFSDAINDCKKAYDLKSLGDNGYLCRAQAEFAINEFQNAIFDYDEVVKLNPKNVDAYALRGMAKAKLNNVLAAIDDYNIAIAIDSASTLAYFSRAEAELKLNDTIKAMVDYNTVLQYEPRNSYAYFDRAILNANKGKYAIAISDFNKVLLLNPNQIEALFNRAKLKHALGDYKGAISDYDKVVLLYPYFMEAYYNRAQAKYSLKDFKGYQKDLQIGKVMSDIFHHENNVEYGKDSLLLNNLNHLSADFHNTSDIKPDDVNSNFLPIYYITEKDTSNFKSKNFSLLLEDFNWNNKQNVCLKNSGSFKTDSSLLHSVSSANKIDSAKKQTLLVFAIYKSNMLLFKEAKDIFDKIISNDSLNAVALFARGINTCRELELQNKLDVNSYIVTNSKQSEIEKSRQEKCKSALADFSKTIRLKPDFYFAYYNRAFVKCLLSDFYGANFDYDKAIKINPRFADAYFNNGYLLYYLNLKQASCENFSKAGELGVSEAFSIIKKHCNGTVN